MIPASAAFIAAEASAGATKKRKLLCHLRNVAHRAEGAIATAIASFATSAPYQSNAFAPSGAIDGIRHHLYFGSAIGPDNGDGDAVAEDGIGGSGWKSDDASQANTLNTNALWAAGIQAGTKVLGDSVALAIPGASSSPTVNVLVVAGGGGGGSGGGGAGGYRVDAAHVVAAGGYTVTVGAAGAAGTGSGVDGGQGGDSTFDTITSAGGGGGGSHVNGINGGSGSGGVASGAGTTVGGTATPAGQGHDGGGNGGFIGSPYGAGGGGGAGAVGGTSTGNGIGGPGGTGTANSISGASVTYAGGGGGGTFSAGGTPGAGGAGGGGAGGSGAVGHDATANTGGGGGGAGNTFNSGAGGSGIVIIAFPIDGSTGVLTSSTGGTITQVGGNQIHTFTAGGTFTAATSAIGPLYESSFDAGGDGVTIVGFESWVNVSGTGTIETKAAAAWPASATGRRGVHFLGGGASQTRIVKRTGFALAGSPTGYLSFRVKQFVAGNAGSRIYLELWKDGTASRLGIIFNNDLRMTYFLGAGAETTMTAAPILAAGWNRVDVYLHGSVASSVTADVFLNGLQVDSIAAVDMTGWDSVRMTVGQAATGAAPEWYLDDLRIGAVAPATSGTQETVIDFGAVPASGRAALTLAGDTPGAAALVAGGSYSLANADADYAFAQTAANQRVWQSITPAARSTISGLRVNMKLIGTPGLFYVYGDAAPVFVELQATTAGKPNGTILATSRAIDKVTIGTTARNVDFVFPLPFTTDETGTTVYALVFQTQENAVNYGLGIPFKYNGLKYYSIRVDASSPGYGGGSFGTYNGSTYTADTSRDLCFALTCDRQVETSYAFTNRDGDQNAGRDDVATKYAAQGFTVPLDVSTVVDVRLMLKIPNTVTYPAGRRLFVEIQGDDGTGKPNGVALAESARVNPNAVLSASYAVVTFPFAAPVALLAGVQYHWVLKTNWTDGGAATDFVHLGVDQSSPSYAGGTLHSSDSASPPNWSLVSGKIACFEVSTQAAPFVRLALATSPDNSTWSSYAKISDNPTRSGSPAAFTVSGLATRYWRIRATLASQAIGGTAIPAGPALSSLANVLTFMTAKWIDIDFGADKTISTVEICAHPTRGGCRGFYLQGKPNGGSYTPITAIGNVEARAKGGTASGATASVVIGGVSEAVVSGAADWWRVNFSADQTIRNLRIYVVDNIDNYARINAIEARRTVDLTSRIPTQCHVSQDSDPLNRVLLARQLSVQLQNADGFLTRTSGAAPWSDQVGAGCILYLSAGYEGTELLPMGIFYVDDWWCNWNDTVDLKATDGFQLMNKNVPAEYRANASITALVEYLANLSNVPSTWLSLDACTTTVPLFTAENPNAWTEAQAIRESVAFSSLFWDSDGYLKLRLSGSSGHGTPSNAIANIATLFGPPQVIGDYAYTWYRDSPGSYSGKLGVARYDLKAGTWKIMAGGPVSLSYDGATNTFVGATVQQFGGNLYAAAWTAFDYTSPFFLLMKYDVAADAISFVTGLSPGINIGRLLMYFPLPPAFGSMSALPLEGGSKWYFARLSTLDASMWYPDMVWEIDLATLILRAHTLGSPRIFSGIARESGNWVLAASDQGTAPLKLYAWNPHQDVPDVDVAGALSTGLTLAGTDASGFIGTTGIAATGAGYIYASTWEIQRTTYAAPMLYKVTVNPGGAAPTLVGTPWQLSPNVAATDKGAATFSGQAAAYVDGLLVIGAQVSLIAGGGDQQKIFYLDEKDATPTPKDAGPFSPGVSNYRWATPFLYAGRGRILLYTDVIRTIDVSVRSTVQRVAVPQYTISHAAGGVGLPSPKIGFGPTRSGGSRIINFATVTSQALAQDSTTKVVWTAQGLPWIVPVGADDVVLRIRTPLSDPIDVLDAKTDVLYAKTGGLVSWKFTKLHATNPELQITIKGGTGTTTFIALSILGKPFYARAGLTVYCTGNDLSLARYGEQDEVISNDYFQDLVTMAIVGASVVSRFELPGGPIEGVQSVAVLRAQILDLATVVAPKWGPQRDLVVFSFDHDLVAYKTTWRLGDK
jgi:hypothetical protein